MKEVVILRFRKIGDVNTPTTKQSTRDLFKGRISSDKGQIGNETFSNFLVGKFEVGERFISYSITGNKKDDLTLGKIALIDPVKNTFAVTSDVDGSATYFNYRQALGVIDNGMKVTVLSTPDNFLDEL